MVRESLRIRQDLHVSNNFLYNQSRNEQELINFIESIMESDNIPGLSVAVVKGEHIVWDKSFGMANIEQNIPVSDTTMFMLASVSKTITATALMQLWEDDLINLDEDNNSYLPFNVVHPDYPNIPITPKMLLTHTSGIKDNWNVMDYYDGDSELALGYYLEQYLTPNGDFYNQNAGTESSITLINKEKYGTSRSLKRFERCCTT